MAGCPQENIEEIGQQLSRLAPNLKVGRLDNRFWHDY